MLQMFQKLPVYLEIVQRIMTGLKVAAKLQWKAIRFQLPVFKWAEKSHLRDR